MLVHVRTAIHAIGPTLGLCSSLWGACARVLDAISGFSCVCGICERDRLLCRRLHSGEETRGSFKRLAFIATQFDVLHQTKCSSPVTSMFAVDVNLVVGATRRVASGAALQKRSTG
jgi:hypothetical protein